MRDGAHGPLPFLYIWDMNILKRYSELIDIDRRKVDLLMDMLENDERNGVLSEIWYDHDSRVWRSTYVRLGIEEENRVIDLPWGP